MGMMELADMQDLGSCAEMRWGSNPHARTRVARQSNPQIAEFFATYQRVKKNGDKTV